MIVIVLTPLSKLPMTGRLCRTSVMRPSKALSGMRKVLGKCLPPIFTPPRLIRTLVVCLLEAIRVNLRSSSSKLQALAVTPRSRSGLMLIIRANGRRTLLLVAGRNVTEPCSIVPRDPNSLISWAPLPTVVRQVLRSLPYLGEVPCLRPDLTSLKRRYSLATLASGAISGLQPRPRATCVPKTLALYRVPSRPTCLTMLCDLAQAAARLESDPRQRNSNIEVRTSVITVSKVRP